jgi:hypothetical protein
MARDLESRSGTSVGKSLGTKAVAVVVLLVAAYILLKLVVGLVTAIAYPVLIILALVGIWWAWRALR